MEKKCTFSHIEHPQEKRNSQKYHFIELSKSWGTEAFTEHSSGKFTELFRIKCGTLNNSENFSQFFRTMFRKCLYPQLLDNSINFIELLFPCRVDPAVRLGEGGLKRKQ